MNSIVFTKSIRNKFRKFDFLLIRRHRICHTHIVFHLNVCHLFQCLYCPLKKLRFIRIIVIFRHISLRKFMGSQKSPINIIHFINRNGAWMFVNMDFFQRRQMPFNVRSKSIPKNPPQRSVLNCSVCPRVNIRNFKEQKHIFSSIFLTYSFIIRKFHLLLGFLNLPLNTISGGTYGSNRTNCLNPTSNIAGVFSQPIPR